MLVRDVMTTHVHVIDPDVSLTIAARKMRDADVGSLLVTKNESVVGVVTDRDLVVRVLAEGGSGHTTSVRQAMSTSFQSCRDDQPVEEAANIIAQHRLRRLPVLDRDGRLVGIVSQSDLAGDEIKPTKCCQVVFYKHLSDSVGHTRDVPLATIHVAPNCPSQDVEGVAISKFQDDFGVDVWNHVADRYEVVGLEEGAPRRGGNVEAQT